MYKIYFELMKYPIFSIKTLNKYFNNENSARSSLYRLIKNGFVYKIRNDMYTCIDGYNNLPRANVFQVSSLINETSFVSYISALEYYGYIKDTYYVCYVSSKTHFNNFKYLNKNIIYVHTDCLLEVNEIDDLRITSLERTIIDMIKDYEKYSSLTVLDSYLSLITDLDYIKLKKMLSYYNNQFLYQKVGFLLERHNDTLNLPNEFFDYCYKKIGKSKRYLDYSVNSYYVKKWQLIVPISFKYIN